MGQARPQDSRAKYPWGWLFLASVVALYVLLFSLDPETAKNALSSFGALLSRILPILAVVFGLMLLFNLFADPKWIGRYVGKRSGLQGWIVAIAAGIFSLGPIYPWYLLLGDLKLKGMRSSLVAVFLYSRAIKLPLVPLMVHYFGLAFTATLLTYILVFAVLNGLLIELLFRETGSGAGPDFGASTDKTIRGSSS